MQKIAEHPFEDLLPEIYRNDVILHDIVAVFEQVYLKNEQRIDGLPQELYNPKNADNCFLDFLGRLVGLRNENNIFQPKQMRALIPIAYKIAQKKGTRQALQEMLSAYLESLCGHFVQGVIIEYADWKMSEIPPEIAFAYPQLYRGESDFVVLFPPEILLQNAEEQTRLESLVRLYCPAIADAHIVVLGVMEALGGLNYLGVNTYL